MFNDIAKLTKSLRTAGLLKSDELAPALMAIGGHLSDEDYRAWFMGEIAVGYATSDLFTEAERFASAVETYERGHFFCKLSEAAILAGKSDHAIRFLHAAENACALFSTEWQRAECLAATAQIWSSKMLDQKESLRLWQEAGEIAVRGQLLAEPNTTTADDTAGVLIEICKCMSRAGYISQAQQLADLISREESRQYAHAEILKAQT